jgi:oxygen-independent coproporphyrinogen-3 oxidase
LQGQEIEQMIEACANSAKRLGLVPYYLYRQKNIAGNFENVGYAKVDKAGIYNILIMEEKETIFAAGAGSTTKIVLPAKEMQANGKETNLVRIENVKEIGEYIRRIDEMIERKEEWLWR